VFNGFPLVLLNEGCQIPMANWRCSASVDNGKVQKQWPFLNLIPIYSCDSLSLSFLPLSGSVRRNGLCFYN